MTRSCVRGGEEILELWAVAVDEEPQDCVAKVQIVRCPVDAGQLWCGLGEYIGSQARDCSFDSAFLSRTSPRSTVVSPLTGKQPKSPESKGDSGLSVAAYPKKSFRKLKMSQPALSA